jgi:methanethiol S-methyltransferase
VRVCAWAGGTLFVASLVYFLFTYELTFGDVHEGPWTPADIAWNAALFTGFAFHHSLFARQPVRALIARMVPADLERTLYVAVASLLFILTCALWRPIPGTAWQLDGAAAWLLRATQFAGVWLTLRSAATLGVSRLSGLEPVSDAPAEFKATGPYGWVRHPIYTGWYLTLFAAPVMTMTRLEFAAISGLYLLLAIPFEERSLLASAGEGYRRYLRQVKWKLVPRIY